MYNKHDFNEDVKVGEIGENACVRLFHTFNDIVPSKTRDVRGDYEWRRKDVDFLFTKKNGEIIKAEAKADQQDTGRMVYELESNTLVDPPTLGWTAITDCDLLSYYFTETKKLYLIKMDELRKWVDENWDDYNKIKRYQRAPITYDKNGVPKSPKNIYIEMKYLEKENFCWLYEGI